jgi:hypothetical protein
MVRALKVRQIQPWLNVSDAPSALNHFKISFLGLASLTLGYALSRVPRFSATPNAMRRAFGNS